VGKIVNENEFRLLGDVSLLNKDIFAYASSRIASKRKKSEEMINQIVTTVLKRLFERIKITKTQIDYISCYWSDYSELETTSEIYELNEKIENHLQNNLEKVKALERKRTPLITANELKCRKIEKGKNILIKKKSDNKDKSNDILLDLSTFLSGIVRKRSPKNSGSGLFCGFGLNIIDNLVKPYKNLNFQEVYQASLTENGKIYQEEISNFASKISKLIDVKEVPSGQKSIGKTPIDVGRSYDNHIKILGCDVGKNGSKINKLKKIGRKAKSYGLASLAKLSEKTFYRLFEEIFTSLETNELIPREATLFISTRRDIPKKWKDNLPQVLRELGYEKEVKEIKFLKNPSDIGFVAE